MTPQNIEPLALLADGHDDPEPIVPMDVELDGTRAWAADPPPGRDDLPLPLLPPGMLEGFGLW